MVEYKQIESFVPNINLTAQGVYENIVTPYCAKWCEAQHFVVNLEFVNLTILAFIFLSLYLLVPTMQKYIVFVEDSNDKNLFSDEMWYKLGQFFVWAAYWCIVLFVYYYVTQTREGFVI